MSVSSETTGQETRKSNLEDLNREDLINKCKSFLFLAQKAKQAKSELQSELESYKTLLDNCETEKKANQDNLQTLQELVDSLTEQKLTFITEIDLAQNKAKAISLKCNDYEEEINKLKANLTAKDLQVIEYKKQLSDFDTERVSLLRQNKRLLEENEQLLNQLTDLEAKTEEFNQIGLQQRDQLQKLEEKVNTDDDYESKNDVLINKIKDLEMQIHDYQVLDRNEEYKIAYEKKIKEVTELYESEKSKKEKANIKLRSYKDKISKCAACINQLKNSRFILSKTVKEYSENIPKWQNDIIKASKVLDDQINVLNNENQFLRDEISQLEKNIGIEQHSRVDLDAEYKSRISVLVSDNEILKSNLSNLTKQTQDVLNRNEVLNKDFKQIEAKYQQLSDHELLTVVNQNKQLLKKLDNTNEKYLAISLEKTELQTTVNSLKVEIQQLNKSEINDLGKKNELLLNQTVELEKQISELSNNNKDLSNELVELKLLYTQLNEFELPKQINHIKVLKEQLDEETKKLNKQTQENNKLNVYIKELKDKNKKINEMQSSEVMETLNLQIKALESEKAILVKEKLNAKDNILELENQNKILSEQVTKLRFDFQIIKVQLDDVLQEKTNLVANYKTEKESEEDHLISQFKALQEQYNVLKKEHDNVQDFNNLLREEVETLKLSLEQPKDDAESLSDLNVSLQTDIVKLETKLSAYKQENASLLAEIKESRSKIKDFDSVVTEYEDAKAKLAGYKTENTELLSEMKEINQVLKERGEAISKLQKTVSEMERLIETLEQDRADINKEKDDLNKRISSLKSELLNAELKTTKISEDTVQIVIERDNAIKNLAEKEYLINYLKDEIEKLKQQSQPDLPNEDMSSSTISKAEEHSRMKDIDETFEDKYTKLRLFALKLKKKLNDATTQLQNVEQDKAKLEKILNENGLFKKQHTVFSNDEVDSKAHGDEVNAKIAADLDTIKVELAAKTQELFAEVAAHKATKDHLEKAKRDVKKKNVLSLEMEDYERSLKELTTKMEESKKKMVQMESTIDTQEGTITATKTQIKLLEEQIKADETQMRFLKEELQKYIEEVKEKDTITQIKNGLISKLEQDLEEEKRNNEEADLEMTSVISEKEKIITSLHGDKAELNNKIKKLEFKCSELNEKLRNTDSELDDLKTEYTSYKVRAQAVLRQNQTVDHSQEEQLKEEVAALRTQLESLTSKLTTSQDKYSELSVELESQRRRANEAAGEANRAQQRTARLQADLTRLGQQLDSERTQHKLQVSTLTQCYKTQINDLESKLQREVESLQMQLATAKESDKSARISVLDQANQNQYMVPLIPKEEGSDGEIDINVSMLPREEGEGSESAPSPPLSKSYLTSAGSRRSPVPLERLLEEGVPEDEVLDTSSLALTPDQEIADLRRKLQAQQQRVKHVTMLLAESERECARMGQLAELVKAELRRVRGAAPHAHNTEYMKNVTLKFLTLPPGDERSRLVPVLHKILTLTPEEMHKIQAVAKGLDPNPNKGWGSYLAWPGGK